MPLTTDELVEKSKEQRKRRRYEEALVSSIAAAESDHDNAEAWWQVALNRLSLGDARNALPALERTVELAPHFSPGWARYGTVLLEAGNVDSAKKSFETALEKDSEQEEALKALAGIYYRQNKNKDRADEKELSVLTRLESVVGLSSYQLNRIGILHYQNKSFFEAIKYWERDVPLSGDPASLFNLGLAYNDPEVSQDADAIDMWRLTAKRYPEFSRSNEYIAKVLPRLLALAKNATKQVSTLLIKDEWYSFYLSPFELLNSPNDLEFYDIEPKTIQRLKKVLLQEIELEDGLISWMSGVHVDKSKAIGLCEELSDDTKREFHWYVYQNKSLLDFLSRGNHTHFLVGEAESPLETLELLEDQDNGFREWLSDPFAKQFDLVLSKSIDQKNLPVLECLLDGRRWVAPPYADRCFENTRRQVSRLLEPMRSAHARANDVMPTVESITSVLEQGLLVDILNLLPAYFRDLQNEVPALIHDMARSCCLRYSNADLSKDVLQIAQRFIYKSAELNHRLEDDFKQIEELIREERRHEVRLTKGNEKWEITKEGVFHGSRYFHVSTVASVRWGMIVTRESYVESYDFLLGVTNIDGVEIQFAWKTSAQLEKNQENFGNLVNAALNYLLPPVVEKINNRLKGGHTVQIGPCSVSERGVQFETKGWIFSDKHFIPWQQVKLDVENGELVVSDSTSRKARVQMSLRSIGNAPVLHFLAHLRNPN